MGKSRREHAEAPDEEKHQGAPFAGMQACIPIHSSWEVPADENQQRDDSLRRDLCKDRRKQEDPTRVGLGWLLAGFEQRSAADELLDDQLRDITEDDHEEEDCKYLILETLDACWGHPE